MVIACLQGGKVDKQEFVGNSLSLGEWRCGRSRAYEPGVRRVVIVVWVWLEVRDGPGSHARFYGFSLCVACSPLMLSPNWMAVIMMMQPDRQPMVLSYQTALHST